MPFPEERLAELVRDGWRLTRDGSTSTAMLVWEDPDEPESGWELLVLHTSGHPPRFTLEPLEAGLTERPAADARRLGAAFAVAVELLDGWRGEPAPDPDC